MDGAVLWASCWSRRPPAGAEYIDARHRRVLAHVTLDIPAGCGAEALRRSWEDPDGSHAEGVVMLSGRAPCLVVKEKDPAAPRRSTCGPATSRPPGLRSGHLARGRRAPGGNGCRRAPGAGGAPWSCWRCGSPPPKMREVCPGPQRRHGRALGAEPRPAQRPGSRCIAVVPAAGPGPPTPFAGSFEATAVWRMSGIEDKPEGHRHAAHPTSWWPATGASRSGTCS